MATTGCSQGRGVGDELDERGPADAAEPPWRGAAPTRGTHRGQRTAARGAEP